MQLFDAQRPPGSPGGFAIDLIPLKGMFASAQGLLGRPGLAPGWGLLLKTKQVHTVGMRFTIDTVYLARNGEVLRVATMPPGRFGPLVLRARWILEMAGGEAQRLAIVTGTVLEFSGPESP